MAEYVSLSINQVEVMTLERCWEDIGWKVIGVNLYCYNVLQIEMRGCPYSMASVKIYKKEDVIKNSPPTVDAGVDQRIRLPEDTLTLNGIATDDTTKISNKPFNGRKS